MAEKILRCAGDKCGVYLGTVRDGSLHKGLVTLCPACDDKRKKAIWVASTRPTTAPISDLMKDIFGKAGGN